jgi:hypothetical protein
MDHSPIPPGEWRCHGLPRMVMSPLFCLSGPNVRPPSKSGLGTRLLQQAVPGAVSKLLYESTGFVYRLRVSLQRPRLCCKARRRLLARNDRIVTHQILNRHCALASALESILLVLTPKIVLPHNPPQSGQTRTDVNDPQRSFDRHPRRQFVDWTHGAQTDGQRRNRRR